MSAPIPWDHVVVASAFSLYGAWLFVHNWSKARHVADTPTSKIRSAAQGFTELCGVLQEDPRQPLLEAPLTASRCLWWHYRIEEYRRSGKSGRWHLLESASSEQPLRLRDATGECLIEPKGAEVITAHRRVWTGSARHPRGLAQQSLLGRLMSSGRYRYTEERLHPGDPLYALGEFLSVGGGRDAHAGVGKGQVIREWKQDYPNLLQRFDADGNGQLDLDEWEGVQLAAEQEVQNRRRQAALAPVQHRLVKPGEGRPFLLSTRGEEALVQRYYWKGIGSALLCLVSALVAAASLLGKL